LNFVLSQGFDGFGSDLSNDEHRSNPEADSTFTSAKLNLASIQRLFQSNTLLTLKGSGQLSSSPLPSPEAFTFGGTSYGRGFKNVYLLGDEGWSTSLELSQQINTRIFNKFASLTPFTWVDYGRTWYKQGPLTDQSSSTYGVGLRSTVSNFTMEIGWGIPASNSFDKDFVGVDNSIVYFNTGWRF
jgi:hemolysin activation/secretion protein